MTTLPAKLQAVRARIADAARLCGRDAAAIRLLAVSKTWPAAALRELAAAGQKAFGESYVQEAVGKIDELRDLDIEWHFIGALQANKTRLVAESFDWVHSVDSLRIAQRLAAQRPATMPELSVCLQVNISGEASKAGATPSAVPALAQAVAALPRLRLRGLMAIPEANSDFAAQRSSFRRLRELSQRLQADGLALDSLSMGMSHDLEAAIAEGATLLRVGTAIFGERR
ncbi:YggS family pyridoxal phosphate-dependent enzyme [Accumulibacter sp.]|uniref:YggS family pyridoxal phosphate-dependent enzyme n=1 Tax=Accumulibacter sp. TaxID=2053492 RepID=UPI0025D44FDC|nr:YggS family pyridoxal phosphate-dependent enzyme [Accumulibacter sp.]MCM8613836.1 YggS family pyridoxal phosphate-dependent enzyme [Accumulibacter sp.]MCM8637510.1 YggS family pyridoxal phosphate-dependent enzyme [Accumulibacter sp.]MCM8640956.1 YggS family pyridoxal phosphate-dependent enzyme [Accumulibacter sp.]